MDTQCCSKMIRQTVEPQIRGLETMERRWIKNYLNSYASNLEEPWQIYVACLGFDLGYGIGTTLGATDIAEAYLQFDPATLTNLKGEKVIQRYLFGTSKAIISAALICHARDIARSSSYTSAPQSVCVIDIDGTGLKIGVIEIGPGGIL